MSIKIKDYLQMDKLKDYYESKEKEKEKREQIYLLTKQLIEKKQISLNRGEQIDKRFNLKLKDMKQLNTFIDAKEQISDLNIMNNKELMKDLSNQFLTQNKQEKTPKKINGFSIFHYNKGKVQEVPVNIDPKLLDQQNDNKKQCNITNLTLSNNSKYEKIIDEIFSNQSHSQYSKQNSSQIKIIEELYKKGILLNSTSQLKLSVQKYYQKYESKTNDLIKRIKLKSREKYENIKRNNSQSFEKKSQSADQQQRKSIKQQSDRPQSQQIYITELSKSSPNNSRSPPKSVTQTYYQNNNNERNSTLKTMIQNYQQCKGLQKHQQYRNRIGNKFSQFNKSLTEVETDILKHSRQESQIIKEMDSIVTEVYQKYQHQYNLFTID